jgi:hypothetical protein
MKIGTITLGDINGTSTSLPDRPIIKVAQRNMCMSAAFWTNIKSGKFPYVFDEEKKTLVEASYNETMDNLKGKGKIYWITDEEFPEANDTMKDIAATEELKQSYLKKVEKFTK